MIDIIRVIERTGVDGINVQVYSDIYAFTFRRVDTNRVSTVRVKKDLLEDKSVNSTEFMIRKIRREK